MHSIILLSLGKATWETIYMVFISSVISIILGLALGCLLFLTRKKEDLSTQLTHRGLGLVVNLVRSLPFIILMIVIIPFTRLIVGTSIGINAAIVPLAIAAIPFYARICEGALAEVPHGLVEAANAMGATQWQIVTKILLPESLPALIRGATLTVIGLIGYSAMAGAIGGGGLGELAINYGYQRFDLKVMFLTVVALLIMVQLIQVLGDHFAKQRQLKPILFGSLILTFFCGLYQFYPAGIQTGAVLRVGVMSGWSQQVMQAAQTLALKKYGLHIQIVTFSDYVQPNLALQNKSIDANIFQHLPYLEAQTQAYHLHLSPIGKTFVYPMGFYSHKITALNELKDRSIVAIPNDPSNGSRALLLLEKYGLIKLREGVTTLASVKDIIANPLHLQFKLLDAAQLPRSLNDADLVAITNDFIGPAGLTIQQALMKEGPDSLYANLIVVRTADKDKPIYQTLVKVMHSNAVLQETDKLFPKGAAIPAWVGE